MFCKYVTCITCHPYSQFKQIGLCCLRRCIAIIEVSQNSTIFSKFPLDYQQIAGFIFKLFFVTGGQWYLSMDRTNWRWGKSDINILMLRWEIECLFGCFKGRGFNFEDTHITDKERIKKLVALLAIAFTWAHRTGEWQNEQRPIKIKKHGRPAVSLFRYGLDFLCDSIARLAYKTNHFQQALRILNSIPSLTCS